MNATLEERAENDPWSLVEEALGYEAKGEPVPDDLQDAVSLAACLMTAVALHRRMGATEEQLAVLFDEREWSVKCGYNLETRELSCEILWDHGEQCTVTGRPESGDSG